MKRRNKADKEYDRKREWHSFFPIWPRRLEEGRCCAFEEIERKTQDIDPKAPNYHPASSYFPQQKSRCYRPDAIIDDNIIEFKPSFRGNGKLQNDFYDAHIQKNL